MTLGGGLQAAAHQQPLHPLAHRGQYRRHLGVARRRRWMKLGLETQVILWRKQSQVAVSTGVELTLPTGSRERRLGGDFVVAPFLSAGLVVGSVFLVGHVEYDWNVCGPSAGDRELNTSVAVGYRLRELIPFLELTNVTVTRERAANGEHRLLDRLQLYVTPGVNWEVTQALTLSLGVQVPVTHARTLDYTLIGALDWSF